MPEKISRRGVYKDLNLSPYEFRTPYGDLFKFPSQKKLDIYTRDIQTEMDRVGKTLSRLQLVDYMPPEIVQLLYRATYRALYHKVVG